MIKMKGCKVMLSNILQPIYEAITPEIIKRGTVDQQRQFQVMTIIITLSCFFFMMFGTVSAFQGQPNLSFIDFSFAAMFIVLGLSLRHTGRLREISSIILTLLAMFFFYQLLYNGREHSSWVWYYTFPLWTIYLKGKETGATLAAILMLVTITTLLFIKAVNGESLYSLSLMIRFVSSYACVTIISYFIEDMRQALFQKLQKTSNELNNRVQELELVQKKNYESSLHSEDTGLYNRIHFDHMFEISLSYASEYKGSISLILLNIDYFTNYREIHSSAINSQTLNHVAKQIKRIVKRSSDAVFHFTDDSFMIILNSADYETTVETTEELITKIQELKIPHKRSPFKTVTVSAGAVTLDSPYSKVDRESIIEQTERALQSAKQKGRNCSVVGPYVEN